MSETRAREDSLAVVNRYLAALNARNNAGIDDPLRALDRELGDAVERFQTNSEAAMCAARAT